MSVEEKRLVASINSIVTDMQTCAPFEKRKIEGAYMVGQLAAALTAVRLAQSESELRI